MQLDNEGTIDLLQNITLSYTELINIINEDTLGFDQQISLGDDIFGQHFEC
jgi:hypothetical protein